MPAVTTDGSGFGPTIVGGAAVAERVDRRFIPTHRLGLIHNRLKETVR